MENKYFWGNKISEYGVKNGRLDYGTFAECFNHILNNQIIKAVDDWEEYNGELYNEELEEETEVFQWFIVDDSQATLNLLKKADEIVLYSPLLDVYLWGVTHFGTSWDYVLTCIEA